MKQAWTVHKFGGASLAGPWEFCRVADILAENKAARQAVIVSASYGVTDRLLRLLETAVDSPDALAKQHGCRTVRFQVQTRGNQVVLRPVLIR